MKKIIKEGFFIFLVAFIYFLGLMILFLSPRNLGFGNLWISLLGLFLGFSGLIVWAVGFFMLGKSFSILPEPREFKKSGIYHYLSHPIYLGISFAFFGLSLATGSFIGFLYTLLILTPFNFSRAKREEKLLKSKYFVDSSLRSE